MALQPESIEITGESERFAYAFTQGDTPGFVKLTLTPDTNGQLKQESQGTQVAAQCGISSVRILNPYQETAEGRGIIHTEQLTLDNGTILTSPELITGADADYGRRAGELLSQAIGREVPEGTDVSSLKSHWRTASQESFWEEWEFRNSVVLDPQYDSVRENYIPRQRLTDLLQWMRAVVNPRIAAAQSEKLYFAHNDLAPNNLFLSDTEHEEGAVLDFEHASATHNQVLAELSDYGNFYARCWPNPEIQQEFLTASLTNTPMEKLEDTFIVLRAAAIFGTTLLARFAMDPDSPEHAMAVSLLSHLETNLRHLDEAYAQLLESKADQT